MLTDDQRRVVELDIATDFLDVHKPYTWHGAGTTEDPVSKKTLCRYCLVPYPCARAAWAQEKQEQWRKQPALALPASQLLKVAAERLGTDG